MGKYVDFNLLKSNIPGGVAGGEAIDIRIKDDLVKKILNGVQKDALTLTRSKKLSHLLAQTLIALANDSGLVPYRDEYPLKKKRKTTIKEFLKTGKKETTFEDLTYKGSAGEKRKIRKTYLKPRGGDTELVSKNKDDDYHRLPATKRKGKRYFTPLKSYYIANREGKRKDKETGEEYTTSIDYPVADRPPHLIDSYKITTGPNGLAQISYSVQKEFDDRFSNNSKDFLQDYAAKQYYASDATWKRFTDGSTSRWLEVAIGLPVKQHVRVPHYKGAEENMEVLTDQVRDALSDMITKRMRGKK